MMVDVYPEYSRVVHRFGRIHHHVNYLPFKKNKLIKKDNLDLSKEHNNYGMELKKNAKTK